MTKVYPNSTHRNTFYTSLEARKSKTTLFRKSSNSSDPSSSSSSSNFHQLQKHHRKLHSPPPPLFTSRMSRICNSLCQLKRKCYCIRLPVIERFLPLLFRRRKHNHNHERLNEVDLSKTQYRCRKSNRQMKLTRQRRMLDKLPPPIRSLSHHSPIIDDKEAVPERRKEKWTQKNRIRKLNNNFEKIHLNCSPTKPQFLYGRNNTYERRIYTPNGKLMQCVTISRHSDSSLSSYNKLCQVSSSLLHPTRQRNGDSTLGEHESSQPHHLPMTPSNGDGENEVQKSTDEVDGQPCEVRSPIESNMSRNLPKVILSQNVSSNLELHHNGDTDENSNFVTSLSNLRDLEISPRQKKSMIPSNFDRNSKEHFTNYEIIQENLVRMPRPRRPKKPTFENTYQHAIATSKAFFSEVMETQTLEKDVGRRDRRARHSRVNKATETQESLELKHLNQYLYLKYGRFPGVIEMKKKKMAEGLSPTRLRPTTFIKKSSKFKTGLNSSISNTYVPWHAQDIGSSFFSNSTSSSQITVDLGSTFRRKQCRSARVSTTIDRRLQIKD